MGYTVIFKKNEYGDYLIHHGIKGQKWGVRRYQNEDGTLTDVGRKRLAKSDAKYSRRNPKQAKAASEYRDDEIKREQKRISSYEKNIAEYEKTKRENLAKKDFTNEARKQLKEFKELYDEMGIPLDERGAIEEFYASIGEYAPKNATIKDVADAIKQDTIKMQKLGTYDKLIDLEKEFISEAEKRIQKYYDTPLAELYKNASIFNK